ncbi:hypothetical protein [Oerskovia enterophila]|nr:hypothetical protein [Oerskovia enterophila]
MMDPLRYFPDGAAGGHRACSGDAWNYSADEPTDCAYGCHQEDR